VAIGSACQFDLLNELFMQDDVAQILAHPSIGNYSSHDMNTRTPL
jgi:hypothetical protein